MGGPRDSVDRPGMDLVFGLRGGYARVSYGMYTAAGRLPNRRTALRIRYGAVRIELSIL